MSSPPHGLLDQMTADDLAKVTALYETTRGPLSPDRVRNHFTMLDADGRPRYSKATIEHALHEIQKAKTGARPRPTAENRAARQLSRDLDHLSTRSAASPLQRFHIRVRYENTRVQQEVDSDVPLATLLHFIAQALDMPADQHIRLGYSENDEFVLLLSDADLHAAMQNGSRDFVVRLRTGGSSSASSAGTVAESAGVTPARLSSDLQHQLFQQKQWAFSAQVREAVHKRAIAIFPGGATFGAANLDKSMPDLFSFLQACCQLHEQWEGFRREQNAAGIAESQLCECFIEGYNLKPSLGSLILVSPCAGIVRIRPLVRSDSRRRFRHWSRS